MQNFLIEITQVNGSFFANYADGQSVQLNATNYADAVCETDMLDIADVENELA